MPLYCVAYIYVAGLVSGAALVFIEQDKYWDNKPFWGGWCAAAVGVLWPAIIVYGVWKRAQK